MTGESRFLILHLAVCITVGYARPRSRIVDNMEAYKIPYQVSLQTTSGGLWCGGVILDATHILTAAHCFMNDDGKDYLQKLVIVTGTSDIKNRTSSNTFQIARVTVLSNFKPRNSYENDIAIVKLKRNINFTKYQQPVKLPSADTPVGSIIITSGWGASHWSEFHQRADTYPQYIRYFYSTVISQQKCQKMMPTENIQPGHMCAWARGKSATCKGDSGGPAIIGRTIIGVISFNQYCNPLYPDVYTRVYKYVDWIRETMMND